MWEARQVRKVRRTVIAKNQAIVLVLTMIAVVKWDEGIIFDNDGLVDLQQMALLKAKSDSQVCSFRCENFFNVALNIDISTLKNGLLYLSK